MSLGLLVRVFVVGPCFVVQCLFRCVIISLGYGERIALLWLSFLCCVTDNDLSPFLTVP